MSEINDVLIRLLGPSDVRPGSNNHIANTTDAAGCFWPTGHVTLLLDGDKGFVLCFQRADTFGPCGDLWSVLTLPRDTPIGTLAVAVADSVHHFRDGAPLPNCFRWGVAMDTPITSVGDALEQLGITPYRVSAADLTCYGQCDTGPRTVMLFQGDGQPWFSVAVDHSKSSGSTTSPADRWFRFPLDTAPSQMAAMIAYWLKLESINPNVYDPDRHGLNREDVALNEVALALHKRGLRIVRADSDRMRMLTGGELLPGMDCLTLLDPVGRILVLGKSCRSVGSQVPGTWTLHTFTRARSVVGVNDGEIWPLVPLTAGLTLDGPCSDFGFPVRVDRVSPLVLADRVAKAFGRDGVYATELSLLELSQGHNLDHLRVTISREDALRRGTSVAPATPQHPSAPRPKLRLLRTPQDAEYAAAVWMRWMGYEDAEVTGAGADGGVDVTSRQSLAQVKTETVPVGRPALQRLYGVASANGKQGLFFSLSGYTLQAVEWADLVGMPLFQFDFQGEPQPVNAEGQQRLG